MSEQVENEHRRAALYEAAIMRFQEYLTRGRDGTFRLTRDSAKDLGMDPVIFADLKRSLEETNRKIKRGEIDPDEIRF